MGLDDFLDENEQKCDNAMITIESLPDLGQKISYTDYYNSLVKKINSIKNDILNYDMPSLLNSKRISKSFCNNENIEEYLYKNNSFYGLLIEFFDINKEDFKKKDYYYFIIEDDFLRTEKKLYDTIKEDSEKPKEDNTLFYII